MKLLLATASAALLITSAATAQTTSGQSSGYGTTSSAPPAAATGISAGPGDPYDDAPDQDAMRERFSDRTFAKIDENGDQMIDRAEWGQFMTQWLAERRERFDRRFNTADENGDGMISREEAARHEPILAHHFDSIDRDVDGRLTSGEIRRAIRMRQHNND